MKAIGEEIQQARLEKGIDLEEIANHTHIQLAHLVKIENGQFDFLPRPYVTAFIKSFAEYVGLNGEEVVKRWREHEEGEALPAERQPPPKAAPQRIEGRKLSTTFASLKPKTPALAGSVPALPTVPYLKEILIGVGMIVVMAALIFLMTRLSDERANDRKSVEPAQLQERPFDQVTRQAQELAKSRPDSQAAPPSNELILQAQFERQARVRVVRDGKDTTIAVYRTGETQTWQAKEKFNLRISTGGSVILTLAGKNLGKFGQPSKIGYLTITRDNVEARWITPKPPQPRSAVPLDSVRIRKPQG